MLQHAQRQYGAGCHEDKRDKHLRRFDAKMRATRIGLPDASKGHNGKTLSQQHDWARKENTCIISNTILDTILLLTGINSTMEYLQLCIFRGLLRVNNIEIEILLI